MQAGREARVHPPLQTPPLHLDRQPAAAAQHTRHSTHHTTHTARPSAAAQRTLVMPMPLSVMVRVPLVLSGTMWM